MLIGNNIVNISCSALATSFTISVWGNKATGIITDVLTLLVLIFVRLHQEYCQHVCH
ncbi:MAG: hypothetical protein ACLT33_12285 [Lachnospira pectinoschiza]